MYLMYLANSDVFWIIGMVTVFSIVMSPTLCWILTTEHRP